MRKKYRFSLKEEVSDIIKTFFKFHFDELKCVFAANERKVGNRRAKTAREGA